MSFETDTESKNGLETCSTETVSRYSTTLETVYFEYSLSQEIKDIGKGVIDRETMILHVALLSGDVS